MKHINITSFINASSFRASIFAGYRTVTCTCDFRAAKVM